MPVWCVQLVCMNPPLSVSVLNEWALREVDARIVRFWCCAYACHILLRGVSASARVKTQHLL